MLEDFTDYDYHILVVAQEQPLSDRQAQSHHESNCFSVLDVASIALSLISQPTIFKSPSL